MRRCIAFPGAVLLTLLGLMPAWAQDIDSLSLESLLGESVQSASKYEQTVAEAPASVTLITAEQIERYGYRTLIEILATVRGFYLSEDGFVTYLGTRGFNRMIDYNNRVLLLLNGHTLNDGLFGAALTGEGSELDVSLIDRIEIVRGPGSALYGTGAMFAVINIVTKSATEHDGLAVYAEVGGENRLKSAVTFGKAFANGLHVFAIGTVADIGGADFYYREFDRPETNNGIAEDLNWRRYYGAFVSTRYRGWSAQGLVRLFDQGIPTGDFGSLFNDKDARASNESVSFELKHKYDFDLAKSLMVRSFYAYSQQTLIYPFQVDMPALNLTDLRTNYGLVTNIHSVGVESMFQWDLRADNRLIVGAQFVHNPQVHMTSTLLLKEAGSTLTFFDDTFPYRVLSFYVQDEYQVRPNLSLTLGLRQDFYSRTGAATTPRAALVYHPFRTTTFKLLYGEAYREPTTTELFFDGGSGLGNIVPVAPNAELTPERIRTTELIWEQNIARGWTTTASLYNYTVRDLIGAGFAPADSIFQYSNASRVEATGLELEMNGQMNEQMTGYASYSYQHTRQQEPDAALTNSPSHLFKVGLTVDLSRLVTVAAETRYESARRTVRGNDTDAYWLLNLHLTTRPLWNHWRLSVRVRNVLDTQYYLPGSQQHTQDVFPQSGRQVLLRLAYTL